MQVQAKPLSTVGAANEQKLTCLSTSISYVQWHSSASTYHHYRIVQSLQVSDQH